MNIEDQLLEINDKIVKLNRTFEEEGSDRSFCLVSTEKMKRLKDIESCWISICRGQQALEAARLGDPRAY